ncbi:FadR/GntR family transcriptional regulator [Anaerolentibacter hominis]|uniref:FadR/GntR family transcriptional regulator n=1 Tax=Anaerolentibacter hominis TaxID=3079009 RepID=UPI0031B8988B
MENAAHKNITEQVVDYLKENIVNGMWKQGERISSENVLTEELQVSRASVRYAIQHLVAVGVLESFQGKGTFVKSIPVEDILTKIDKMYVNSDMEQLLEFRVMIEVESCRLAARRITKEGLNELKIRLVNMMTSMHDKETFIHEDMEFHHAILRATGNRMIARSMELINREVTVQHQLFNTRDKMDQAIMYHRDILAALEAGDGEAAAKHMSDHLLNLKNYIDKREEVSEVRTSTDE